jgi:hypothetical protein
METNKNDPNLHDSPYKDDLIGEDQELNNKEYLGTFRWKRSLKFPALNSDKQFDYFSNLIGWGNYLEQRINFEVEPYIIDALSYPMSIIHAIENIKGYNPCIIKPFLTREKTLNLVVMGASSKAELRIAMESNYFDEIYNYLAFTRNDSDFKMNLHFVGEEIKMKTSYKSKTNENLSYHFFEGKTGDFLKLNALEFSKSNTLFAGLNCGFGAGYIKLTTSWVLDLIKLFKFGFLSIFTYTNSWEDMIGEIAIVEKLLAGKILIHKEENPFKLMTVYQNNEGLWSCGNFGYYIVSCGSKEKICDLIKKTDKDLLPMISELLELSGIKLKQ